MFIKQTKILFPKILLQSLFFGMLSITTPIIFPVAKADSEKISKNANSNWEKTVGKPKKDLNNPTMENKNEKFWEKIIVFFESKRKIWKKFLERNEEFWKKFLEDLEEFSRRSEEIYED